MNHTPIQWTWARGADGNLIPMSGSTWNPALGCRRVSAGCEHCFAERLIAVRFSKNPKLPMYHDIARVNAHGDPRFTGAHRLLPDRLDEPLRARKGRKVFVCDMGDLFFEGHPFEEIAAVWGVMAAAPQHTFQVLTKRPERALEFFAWLEDMARKAARGADYGDITRLCWDAALDKKVESGRRGYPIPKAPWPLPNVHIGVSVEDQAAADKRIPLLLQIPAALHFLSCEPLLGALDLLSWLPPRGPAVPGRPDQALIGWAIAGGESGTGARHCDLAWLRSLRDQCKAAGVPWFCKQLGANARERVHGVLTERWTRNKHGGDMAEWPEDLRIMETP